MSDAEGFAGATRMKLGPSHADCCPQALTTDHKPRTTDHFPYGVGVGLGSVVSVGVGGTGVREGVSLGVGVGVNVGNGVKVVVGVGGAKVDVIVVGGCVSVGVGEAAIGGVGVCVRKGSVGVAEAVGVAEPGAFRMAMKPAQ